MSIRVKGHAMKAKRWIQALLASGLLAVSAPGAMA
jgi:hypothetical protein